MPLRPLRIGSVPYLNARPLIYGIDPLPLLLPPAELADRLHANALDLALVPVAECLLHNEYDLVDGIAIAARNPVYSVVLVTEIPRIDWQTVSLDPASRTSALLTRVLLEKYWQQKVRYVSPDQPADARLIIGDPAREFRRRQPRHLLLDLAEEWTRFTQLPFVFAVWAVRRSSSSRGLANYLREIAARGLAAREEIAQNEEERIYLQEHISYQLDLPEKQAIGLFARHLREMDLLSELPSLSWI